MNGIVVGDSYDSDGRRRRCHETGPQLLTTEKAQRNPSYQ